MSNDRRKIFLVFEREKFYQFLKSYAVSKCSFFLRSNFEVCNSSSMPFLAYTIINIFSDVFCVKQDFCLPVVFLRKRIALHRNRSGHKLLDLMIPLHFQNMVIQTDLIYKERLRAYDAKMVAELCF